MFSFTTKISTFPPEKSELALAVQLLKDGQVVALPTETVYGLAADADDDLAVAKIYAVKNRPITHPLIIHISDINQIDYWGDFSLQGGDEIRKRALKLAEKFMPGALTIIVPRAKNRANCACARQNTIALRFPDNKYFLEIAQNFNGLAAPSANPFGRVSPTTAEHVYDDLQGKIPLIINGGKCQVGIESTIVNCCEPLAILRPGKISAEEISDSLMQNILWRTSLETNNNIPRTSGDMASHYAPCKPLILINNPEQLFKYLQVNQQFKKVAVLCFEKINANQNVKMEMFITKSDPQIYAQELFANLRKMDESTAELLVVLLNNEYLHSANWRGICDRLTKASFLKN